MYNFYINFNGTKEGPYSAAEMNALQLDAATPVAEQSYGDRWFTAKDFDFYYMAKEESMNSSDVVMTEDDFAYETTREMKQPTTATTLSGPTCLDKWCWGGFLMPGLWGIFNGVFWPLVVGLVAVFLSIGDIPYAPSLLTFATRIILGISGHSMSWDYLKGDIDAANFDNRMARWNRASAIITIALILIPLLLTILTQVVY